MQITVSAEWNLKAGATGGTLAILGHEARIRTDAFGMYWTVRRRDRAGRWLEVASGTSDDICDAQDAAENVIRHSVHGTRP